MEKGWEPIDVCVGGTQAFRKGAAKYLPQEPKEDDKAWLRRTSHGVLSPFLTRLAEQAAGLIMRKPIQLEPKEEGGEVDEWWQQFVEDIDGYGTSLDEFARQVVYHSLLWGHSAILVDFPSTEAAPNLQVERELGLRPYFLEIKAKQILGWRKDGDSPLAPVNQIRINEYVTEPLGMFGETVERQIRELFQGGWRVWRKGDKGWYVHQEGTTSLPVIPLAVTYSKKVSELVSEPPLRPIADLNILQSQRQADQQFSLHVASMPILCLAGWDDTDTEIALSANSALVMSPDSKAYYVEPASQSFDAQQKFITELENQMRNLGISTLFQQTFVGETAEAKSMDRSDSDSLLSVIAQDLQKCLQNAVDLAGAYVSRETPNVLIDRDFSTQVLDGQQVGQYLSMWAQGAISHETLLRTLQRGEVLSEELDVDAEIELIEQSKLLNLDMGAAGGTIGEDEDEEEETSAKGEEEESDDESELRKEVKRRLKRLAEGNDDDED